MDNNESIIVCRLKEAMERRNITMCSLAKQSGIDKSIISRYLHGKALPKVAAITKMANVLEVSPAWLSGYDVESVQIEAPKETPSPIDLSKLTPENVTRLTVYYQALLDTQS